MMVDPVAPRKRVACNQSDTIFTHICSHTSTTTLQSKLIRHICQSAVHHRGAMSAVRFIPVCCIVSTLA